MEHEIRTYFRESEEDSVTGFTIINTNDVGEYQIAEKWNKDDADGKWIQYHVTPESLQARIEAGDCEPVGKLTDDQFEAVCEKVPTGA